MKKFIKRLKITFERFVNAKNIDTLKMVGEDQDGNIYYSWDDLGLIPKARFTQIQTFSMFEENKLTPEALDEITHAIDKISAKVLSEKNEDKRVRFSSQIHHLCNELRFRAEYVTPTSVLLNMAACMCVRHDEDPNGFSQIVHDEKLKVFQQEVERGNDFFFKTQSWGKLMPSFVMSKKNWAAHLMNSEVQLQNEKKRLGIILSEQGLKTSSETKKN